MIMLTGINCITRLRQLFDNCRLTNILWVDVLDQNDIARVSTQWMITLEKMGCDFMVQSGQTSVSDSYFWVKTL